MWHFLHLPTKMIGDRVSYINIWFEVIYYPIRLVI